MKTPTLLGILVVLKCFTGLGPLPAATMQRDLVYGEAAGEVLKLDASIPDGDGPFPIVVLIHGGGWSGGDKAGSDRPGGGADITPWFEPLTKGEFTWFSINYRLAPAHVWPACFDDVRTAIGWIRAHAAEFKGDASQIAVIGHSAGGHLALLAAASDAMERPVQAAVGCAAVSDLVSDTLRRGGPSTSLQNLFTITNEMTPTVEARLAAVSPLNHLDAAYPPTLLLHGDLDKTVPIGQSLAFQQKARALGVECDLVVIPGAGHRLTEWAAQDAEWMGRMVDWLRARLAAPVKTAPSAP